MPKKKPTSKKPTKAKTTKKPTAPDRKTKISEKPADQEEIKIVRSDIEDDDTGAPPPPPPTQQVIASDDGYSARSISTEMQESYLDYAMSVIVSRALPDVRDGLKPVHRRILYAMHELGLSSGAKFRKSAAVVGDVLGKYHPHGDTAVYDSMVRMAQDFALRYMLVNGQGNFGSIDGDSAAAMRYTEAKMMKITDEMLADIEKETVDFRDNYDATRQEPTVLPAKLPQLLLNGTSGIAVGMATSIPPHNLNEVVDAVVHLADHPEATIEDLMEFIQGPDFPTGGSIYDINAIKAMYMNGRGGIAMRAKAEIIEKKGGRFAIVVTEIPYQVNKATLVAKIADLVREKRIVGISDLRDQSNRTGIEVMIELKKDAYPKKILNQLFKLTQMQSSFNMNMIALVDGIQPRLLNLKQVLEYFIEHRKITITRRVQYDLKIAKARAHILEGLKKALDHIDEVIKTIKQSKTKEEAHASLMKKFKLSDKQASAILEMRLQTLAGLERKKIEDELVEKLKLIDHLEGILQDPKKVLKIMKDELSEIKNKYGDERRTKIYKNAIGQISQKDTIPNEPMVVALTRENYIKRMPPTTFRTQHRGGKGIIGITTKEDDEINIIVHAKNHEELLFFTNKGRVFKLPVYEVPQAARTSKGQAIVNLLQLQEKEFVTSILNISEKFTGEYLFMGTKMGTVKKTPVKDFENVRRTGLIAIKLRPNDALYWVREVNKGDHIFIATSNGQSIRFDQEEVRSMGRPSVGVRGIALKGKDYCVDMDVIQNPELAEVLIVMENGLGKSTKITSYRLQGRGGSGVKAAKITPKTGLVVGAKVFTTRDNADLIMISKLGQTIRLSLRDIPSLGRSTQGVYLMRFTKQDKIASVSLLYQEEAPPAEPESKGPSKSLKGAQSTKAGDKQKALL
ncbi:DNA gyrase subunit A [Candidatus Peregrinibacteria bacterium CG11_big_fil_rev_8_21_14_0_20_46_8]|nr:MAG: DNA gyrase subunit A [Candidatus Peregrinibacteria bacterium CG11_big_fil_rev_8_21_14_0_20_46_8]